MKQLKRPVALFGLAALVFMAGCNVEGADSKSMSMRTCITESLGAHWNYAMPNNIVLIRQTYSVYPLDFEKLVIHLQSEESIIKQAVEQTNDPDRKIVASNRTFTQMTEGEKKTVLAVRVCAKKAGIAP